MSEYPLRAPETGAGQCGQCIHTHTLSGLYCSSSSSVCTQGRRKWSVLVCFGSLRFGSVRFALLCSLGLQPFSHSNTFADLSSLLFCRTQQNPPKLKLPLPPFSSAGACDSHSLGTTTTTTTTTTICRQCLTSGLSLSPSQLYPELFLLLHLQFFFSFFLRLHLAYFVDTFLSSALLFAFFSPA